MNYPQIDHALTFLTKPGDQITLQVPYATDIHLVRKYIKETWGQPSHEKWDYLDYNDRGIHFELLTDMMGLGRNPCFFIDRDHDRSYMKWLEV
jgi:hypothetical protein